MKRQSFQCNYLCIFLYYENNYSTSDINIVEIIFYRFDSSLVTLEMEKKTREDKWNGEKAEWLTTVEEPI